jgi:hypothetical protein
MPEKLKARSWKGSHTVIAIIAMLTQLALCNVFAGVDRQRLAKKASPTELLPQSPTPTLMAESTLVATCPTIIPKRNLGAKCIARTRSS